MSKITWRRHWNPKLSKCMHKRSIHTDSPCSLSFTITDGLLVVTCDNLDFEILFWNKNSFQTCLQDQLDNLDFKVLFWNKNYLQTCLWDQLDHSVDQSPSSAETGVWRAEKPKRRESPTRLVETWLLLLETISRRRATHRTLEPLLLKSAMPARPGRTSKKRKRMLTARRYFWRNLICCVILKAWMVVTERLTTALFSFYTTFSFVLFYF